MLKHIDCRILPIILIKITILLSSCEKKESTSQGSALAQEVLQNGSGLRIGVSTSDINPINDTGVELEGYGSRKSMGTHDNLTGRCLIIMDDSTYIALVSLDLIGINRGQVQSLKAKINLQTGIAPEHIFIHSTHTHSGPAMVGPLVDNGYLNHLHEQISNAALEALNSVMNVTAILKTGTAETGAINRRNPSRKLLNQFGLIEFRNEAGNNVASLVNYSCHPVVLGPNNYQITADYVHYLYNELEQQLGGTALFFNGSFGDINPPASNLTYPYDRSSGTFMQAETFGKQLAVKMIQEFDMMDTLDINISFSSLEKSYKGQSTDISILSFGDLQIGMVPGEPLELFGQQIMELFPGPYKMIFGATNDFIAYIIPQSQWKQCTSSFLDECYEETLSDEGLAPLLLQGYEVLSNEMF